MILIGKELFTEIVVYLMCWYCVLHAKKNGPCHTFFSCMAALSIFSLVVTILRGVWLL